MTTTSRCMTVAGILLAGLLLTGCGSSGGGASDPSRIWVANQDSDVPRPGPGTGIPVPFNPSPTPTLTPEPPGARLYVTESQGDTLAVYDAESYQLIDRVTVGDDPRGLSFDTVREKVLISLLDGTVQTLDANDLDAAPQSTAPVVDAGSLALLYDNINDAVWVASLSGTDALAALAADTLAHLSGSPVNDSGVMGLGNLALSPDGQLMYVSRSEIGNAAVLVVDATTRAVLHIVSTIDPLGDLNDAADGLAYHPVFDHLYVGNPDFDGLDDDTVAVLDASQDPPVVIQQIPCGQTPSSIAVDLDRNRIYVTNYTASAVQVFSVADTLTPLTLLNTLPTQPEPVSVLYDAENDRIITSNFADDSLTVYDAATLLEIPGSPIPAGDGPNCLYLQPSATP